MNISVIGTGYVGLVSGTCLADLGNKVVCVDNNHAKLNTLRKGHCPFFEPGLDEKLEKNIQNDRLNFTDSLESAVKDTSITFIAVGTPPKDCGGADLSAVFAVAKEIVAVIKNKDKTGQPHVLVTKSTVPVGTGRKIMELIKEEGLSSKDIEVVSNPEFLREGSAIYDFFRPDRIVIGGDSREAVDRVAKLYDPLYRLESPVVKTELETSELSKYASNAFLATKISFINEMACLCEKVGADVQHVAKIMGLDGRIGKYFLHAGPGYGGSCFPKDTKALVKIAQEVDYDFKIVRAAEEVNDIQKRTPIVKLEEVFGNELKGKTIGIWGLAFKPETDDLREAPALTLIDYLLEQGCKVKLYDPEAMDNGRGIYQDRVSFVNDSYEAAEGADALVLMTEWHAFRELDLAKIKGLMKRPVFLDMRNIYKPEQVEALGFVYKGIGRK
jgi:UDPglucose 6-dehydrogenase